jgi:hypothetical protein
MAIKSLFKSRIPFIQYFFKSGKQAAFLNGEFITDTPSEVEELNLEVASGHPHIFIDEDKKTVDTNHLDPLDEIRRKAVEEYKASIAAATDKNQDRGSTEQGKLEGIVSTSTISDASASSDASVGSGESAAASASGGNPAISAALANLTK